VLVEGNVYTGVRNPLSPDDDGQMLARNNLFTNVTGTTTASGTVFTPPYPYTVDPASGIESAVRTGAGRADASKAHQDRFRKRSSSTRGKR
jgi:pectate lyase